MKSKFFTLDWKDFLRGLLIAFLSAVISGIIEMLDTGAIFTWVTIKPMLIAGVSAALILPSQMPNDKLSGPDVQTGACLFLKAEIAGVSPSHVENRPEVEGQTVQDVFIGEPAITVVAPCLAPGVSY